MGINLVSLSGNLTRDPEIRETQGGMTILTFGMAVNDRRKNTQTGEWEDVPNFVDCTIFGSRANALMPYLSKGAKVAVQGKLHYSSWETQDGSKRSKLEVIVDEIEFLSPRKEQGGQRQAPQQQYAAPQQQYAAPQQQYAAPQQQYAAPAAQMPQQTFYPNQAPLPQQQVPQMDVYDQDIPF